MLILSLSTVNQSFFYKHRSAIVKCLADMDADLMPVSICQSVTVNGPVCVCNNHHM